MAGRRRPAVPPAIPGPPARSLGGRGFLRVRRVLRPALRVQTSALPPLRNRDRPAASSGAVDQPCPNCGQPMLAGVGIDLWKLSSGNLRSQDAQPVCGGCAGRVPNSGAQLGLAGGCAIARRKANRLAHPVGRSQPRCSAAGFAMPSPDEEWFDFADEFMSCWTCHSQSPSRQRPQAGICHSRPRGSRPSANGTFVDSHKLGPGEVVKLSEGDIVRVGTTEMVFKSLWLPPSGQGLSMKAARLCVATLGCWGFRPSPGLDPRSWFRRR